MEILTEVLFKGFFEHAANVIEIINNPENLPPLFYSIFQVVRSFFIFFSIFLIAMFVFLTSKSNYFNYSFKESYTEKKKGRPYVNVKLKNDWKEIEEQARNEKESERKIAIMEADDLVSDALSQLGYKGEDVVEKVDGLGKEILPNIEEVKEAHRKRKDFIHNPEKELSEEEAVSIISEYEEVLKNFRIL
jgi:hypothetical protein